MSIPHEKRTIEKIDRYLARRAVESGALTLWQAQQLMNGRWQGLRLGKYVLRQLIGQGGMGRVYLARDTRLGRPVAVKILSRQRSGNPRSAARFEREARVGAQLQHENLIRIYDDGEEYGLRYLVMEYVDGKNAARIILEQGRLPPFVAAELGRQVLLGLEHLHDKGLLHRDVNPANILVDRPGTAKLTDLGLAVDLDDPDILTREGVTVGTFDYISPEQARNPREIDIRSDIYSLGCTIYHMLAGHPPFPALNQGERIMAHQLTEAEPLTTLVPDCPPALAAVIQRMMRKNPAERFARPIEGARELAPFSRGPVPLEAIGPPPRAQPRPTVATASEEAALAAEWFDSEIARSHTGAPPTQIPLMTPSSADVFMKVEADPAQAGTERPGGDTAGWGGLAAVLALSLAVLALILSLSVWW